MVALPGTLALRGIGDLVGEVSQQAGVFLLPEHHAVGGAAVAPGAACLLVVLFNRFGQREMDHGPNVRLVDAESEGDRPNQHAYFVRHPAFLVVLARSGVHFAVVRRGGNALIFQKIDRLFHRVIVGE